MSQEPPVNRNDDELAQLWQSQDLAGERIALEEIRKKAGKFERTIRWRNVREYLAVVFVVISFSSVMLHAGNPFSRIGAGLIVAASLYVTFAIYTRGSSQRLPEEEQTTAFIDFHRLSLERQRDLLQSIWSWYLLPFVPGFAFLLVGSAIRDGVLMNPNRTPEQLQHGYTLLKFGGLMLAFLVLVAGLNKRAAKRLQARIDALESEKKE